MHQAFWNDSWEIGMRRTSLLSLVPVSKMSKFYKDFLCSLDKSQVKDNVEKFPLEH